jgi:gliding motility-associated-like protein
MKRMNVKKLMLALAAICCLGLGKANASHLAAMDIYYNYVSPLVYEVHLILYTDCTGITPGLPSEPGNARSLSLGACIPFQFDTTDVGEPQGQEVSNVCPNIGTQCTTPGSIYVGYRKWHYKDTVTLPSVAPDWEFVWSSCCRNGCVANLSPNSMGVVARLNNVARPVNNSPRLLIDPIPYLCQNALSQYLNGPFDPDNDSVRFVSTTPLDAVSCTNTALATYTGGFSNTNPLPITPGSVFQVDPISGTACFTPTTTGCYVLGFTCYDIDRNTGDTLGTTMRDVQLNVAQCFTPTFVLSSCGVGSDSAAYTICPGQQLCFNDTAISQNTAALIVCRSNNDVVCPGSTFTHPPFAYGSMISTFCWTPTANDAGPHVVIIEYKDSTCTNAQPILLKYYKVIKINVLDGVSGGGPYNYCLNGDSIQLTATGPSIMNTWNWTVIPGQGLPNGSSPNFFDDSSASTLAAPTTTMYVQVQGYPAVGGCPDKDTVLLNVYPALVLNPGGPYDPCANDAIQLNVTTNQAGGSWVWSPANFLSSTTVSNPTCTPVVPETYTVQYTTVQGCKKTVNVPVTTKGIRPIMGAFSEKNPVCKNEPFYVVANGTPQPCGISNTPCDVNTPETVVAIGKDAILSPGDLGPFYRDIQSSYRIQYMYSAAELYAAGIRPGTLKGLTFDVITDNATATEDTLSSMRLKIGCSNQLEFNGNTGFVGGLTTVWTANKFAPVNGPNVFDFNPTTPYFWDGKSNLVVELCYSLPLYIGATSAEINVSNTPYQSVCMQTDFAGSSCNLTAGPYLISSLRPNIKFRYCKAPDFTYSWAAANLFADPTKGTATVNGVAGPTTFTVTAVSGNPACAATATVAVIVDNDGTVDAGASNVNLCEPGYTTLQATPNAVSPLYECGATNYTTTGIPALYDLASLTSAASNINAQSQLAPFSFYAGMKMQYIITAAELQATAGITPGAPYRLESIALEVLTKNTFSPYEDFTVSLACIKSTETSLPSYKGVPMTQVWSSPSYNTNTGWNIFVFPTPYLWNGTDNILVEMCYANNNGFNSDVISMTPNVYTFPTTPMYVATSWSEPGCNLPFGGFPITQSVDYRPKTRITAMQCNQRPFEYSWTPSLYVFDTTIQNTLAYVPSTTQYTVSLTNNNGCHRFDSVTVRIVEHDVAVTPEDTAICPGDNFFAFVAGSGDGIAPTYQWYPSAGLNCPTCTEVFVTPTGPVQYIVVRTDEFGCADTATMDIAIRPTPTVLITNGDSITVPYNSEVNLIATGSQTYSWTPAWAMSNANISNPIIQPQQSALYYVYGLDSASCAGYDSIWVEVDQSNPTVMPSAFSPDGDGNNDVFRPWNKKFENYQEFRVFNRWGQEVYSAKGVDNGWDGTYRGERCDMDTYFYTLRLAYPDGNVKTLRGEVLLVR